MHLDHHHWRDRGNATGLINDDETKRDRNGSLSLRLASSSFSPTRKSATTAVLTRYFAAKAPKVLLLSSIHMIPNHMINA
jgi:hypothetical protein